MPARATVAHVIPSSKGPRLLSGGNGEPAACIEAIANEMRTILEVEVLEVEEAMTNT